MMGRSGVILQRNLLREVRKRDVMQQRRKKKKNETGNSDKKKGEEGVEWRRMEKRVKKSAL